MDPITLIQSTNLWQDNKFLNIVHQQIKYSNGPTVEKVYYYIAYEIYDKHGKLEVSQPNQVDIRT